jgi:hypothetical protein
MHEFLDSVRFATAVWLLPFALALHEIEEWNILKWYHRNFRDLPPKTNTTIRVFLVSLSLFGFMWTGLAMIVDSSTLGAYLISVLAVIVLMNALQHVYWLVAFRDYAPGVITAVLLLIPIVILMGAVAVRQGLLPAWYECLLTVPVILSIVQTMRSGRRLSLMLRATNRIGWFLARTSGLEKK